MSEQIHSNMDHKLECDYSSDFNDHRYTVINSLSTAIKRKVDDTV